MDNPSCPNHGPVDTPLAQLAKGYVAADGETDAPVTRNIDGRWIDLAPGLEGLAIAWRRVLAHYRVEIDVEPLDRLAGALSRGELIPHRRGPQARVPKDGREPSQKPMQYGQHRDSDGRTENGKERKAA